MDRAEYYAKATKEALEKGIRRVHLSQEAHEAYKESLKAIVINDEDAHCHVFKFTVHNLKMLIQNLSAAGQIEEEGIDEILAREDVSTEELVNFLYDNNAPLDRSGGGRIYFVETKEDWDFSYNPFM